MTACRYETVPFDRAVRDSTGGNCKVQRKDYQTEGDTPVIDQGQDFIAGYTDSSNAYHGPLPVVLFGDHTRAFKYVDFPFALGADGVKVLEPLDGFDASFLHYYFRSIRLPNAGYSRHFKFLKEVSVPQPSVPEQRRIVDILSRAEGIVRLRREAQKKAAELIPALFLDMFGDPATNPKGWPTAPLGELCDVKGGGTPSKQNPDFWVGKIPWVSPKDMSGVDIVDDAQDHISSDAVRNSATNIVPVGSILIVTRSGVLKHTIPCAITSREVAINQDIKAFVPHEAIAPHFLLSQIQIRAEEILGLVRVGATVQNIETDALKRIRFVCPSLDAQVKFSQKCEQIRTIQSQQSAATAKAKATFAALLAQVFPAGAC